MLWVVELNVEHPLLVTTSNELFLKLVNDCICLPARGVGDLHVFVLGHLWDTFRSNGVLLLIRRHVAVLIGAAVLDVLSVGGLHDFGILLHDASMG